MIWILVIAVYLLFNVFITMLAMHDDRELKHRTATTIILLLFALPIVAVAVVIMIITTIVETIIKR